VTLDQAIKNLELFGSKAQLPPAFRGLTLQQLEAMREEFAKPTAEQKLAAWARQPLPYNPLDRLRGIERRPDPPAEVQAVQATGPTPLPAPPDTPFERALARPQRTPRRQRAAFLRQLERCLTVAEAAARAGVNRGTLYRWKEKDAEFARRWREKIARHVEETADTIALQANRPEVRPFFYKGKRMGEHQRFNHRLLMHVQNRLDTERRRADDRAERRELAELRLAATQTPAASQSATPDATPEPGEIASLDKALDPAA
jgi:DNA-directed RNA polymerase specialized sigma24 family protein